MKSLFRILTVAATVLSANAAFAQPSYDLTTNHAYEVVYTSAMNFDQAKTYAEGLTLQGVAGHLVTITSPEEQAFVESLGAPQNAWIGAYQAGYPLPDDEGGIHQADGWTWITGEPWGYTAWSAGEPNDAGNNEDCGHWWLNNNSWNDINCANNYGAMIVEWDLPARPVPTLSWPALALLAGALLLLGAGWIQNKRRS